MAESQNMKNVNPNTENVMHVHAKGISRLVVPLVIVVIIILIVTIYNGIFPEGYFKSREFEQNRALWESQHITHYRMSVNLPYETTYYGQLPMPLIIEVKDGNVVSVIDAQGDKISNMDDGRSAYYYENYFTVPGLFSYVHKYYLEKPPSINVSYDPTLGFPDSIYINPYTEPCCDDFGIEIRDFQVLP